MSNRLKFFREQMAAFDGSGEPKATIESGYYVREPKRSASEIISQRLALRPSSTHLLIGGIGSGKTTQLLVMRDRINELEDTYAHYVDVSLYTNISRIEAGTLIALTLEVIAELTKKIDKNPVNNAQELIKKFLDKSKQNLVDILSQEVVLNPDIIPVRSNTYRLQQQLLKKVHDFHNSLKSECQKYSQIIILFDGLDRLDNVQVFSQLVTSDLQAISSMGIGVVLVAPISATLGNYRDTIEQAVNYLTYQHCFDVDKDPESFTFFENILKIRAADGFIEQSAIKSLIHYSGGVMRDLINLTQTSIEEAYLLDSDRLQEKHVEAAVDSLGRAKLLSISDKELEIIENLLTQGIFIPRTDEDIRLLVTSRILDYTYPVRRYVVHPTLESLIPQSKAGSTLHD